MRDQTRGKLRTIFTTLQLQISIRAFFLAPMRFWSITKDTTREARYLPICSSTYVLGGIYGIPVSRPHEPLPVPYAFWYS